MMCAATVNWTLVTDITSPAHYVMLKSTIGYTPVTNSADRSVRQWTSGDRNECMNTANLSKAGFAAAVVDPFCHFEFEICALEPSFCISMASTNGENRRSVSPQAPAGPIKLIARRNGN